MNDWNAVRPFVGRHRGDESQRSILQFSAEKTITDHVAKRISGRNSKTAGMNRAATPACSEKQNCSLFFNRV